MNSELNLNYEINRAYRRQLERTAHRYQMAHLLAQPTQAAAHIYSRLVAVLALAVVVILGRA